MRRASFVVAALVALVGAQALAASVYLNGVKIDGVTNQKFEKASVKIDERGDVHIDAPGYAAKVVQGDPAAAMAPGATPKLTRRYWLVTEQSSPGATEYDIDVYVNSRWIRKLRSADEQLVLEITKHLVPGKNQVLFNAKKLPLQGARRSKAQTDFFRVLIGEGDAGGDKVMIDTQLIEFKRTAADLEDFSKEFSFTTR